MRIAFFLAVWKRPEITELCFMGLQRLMKHYPNSFAFAVISEKSMIPLCQKYDIEYCEHENLPLGRKKNYGMNQILKKQFDYLIELGSDDLIFNDVFDVYKPYMERGEDFFGSNQMIFVDAVMGVCRHYTAQEAQYGFGWGLGRCFSRKLLEHMSGRVKIRALTGIVSCGECISDGEESFLPRHIAESLVRQGYAEIIETDQQFYMWSDNVNRSLDNNSTNRLLENGFNYKIAQTREPFLADIKSDENIWGYNPEIGAEYDLGMVLDKMSELERKLFFINQKKLRAKRIETAV